MDPCRICSSVESSAGEALPISLCACKSDNVYHISCMSKWLGKSNTMACDLCKVSFQLKRKNRSIWEFLRQRATTTEVVTFAAFNLLGLVNFVFNDTITNVPISILCIGYYYFGYLYLGGIYEEWAKKRQVVTHLNNIPVPGGEEKKKETETETEAAELLAGMAGGDSSDSGASA